MCYNLKLAKMDKKRYWIFNKEVTKEEWKNRFDISYEERAKCDKCGQEFKDGD